MRASLIFLGLLVGANAQAATPNDFAKQWPVTASDEGAYALVLDESVYRQTVRSDLSDIAAFNADGEALPFGPMPASYCPPPSRWQDVAWFAVPGARSADAGDLHLHVSRSSAGDLQLDANVGKTQEEGAQSLLIDVRAKDHEIEAMAFDLVAGAPDFSAAVRIEASDDLQHWDTVVDAATLAQLHQNGQVLSRRHVEFAAVRATYLRVSPLDDNTRLPVTAVHLQVRPPGPRVEPPARRWFAADAATRDGRAFVYKLPARIPVEQLAIDLADDNTVADFTISTRDDSKAGWQYFGTLTAFRLRGAGLALDNEPMDLSTTRAREWRIEPNIELAKAPSVKFAYRPETWLLLTHGRAPFVIAAGSPRASRSDFPLEALVGQIRGKYGVDWQPQATTLGAMKDAGGVAALAVYGKDEQRNWILWGVLLLGATLVIAMVLKLLKSPPA